MSSGRWRVGLIDSCGVRPGAFASARFARVANAVILADPIHDESGHGSRLADVIANAHNGVELVLGQVLNERGRTSAEAVACAIDWCLDVGVDLIHLSLGLSADRAVLAAAIGRAVAADKVIIASVPARGEAPYPAAYPGVIRGTGDARCGPGELSRLDENTFGGCAVIDVGAGRGASVGAAHVTRELTRASSPRGRTAAIEALEPSVRWHGRERRSVTG